MTILVALIFLIVACGLSSEEEAEQPLTTTPPPAATEAAKAGQPSPVQEATLPRPESAPLETEEATPGKGEATLEPGQGPTAELRADASVDDFESGDFHDRWWPYVGGETESFTCMLDQPGHASAQAMRLTFDVGADGYAGCGLDVDAGRWGEAGGLSFFWRSFPLSTASWIRNAGSIPYIRLMLRSSEEQNVAEPTFTLDRIISGDFDDDLRIWARDARDFGSPLIGEYGTEVNGECFSWNGIWNGAGTLDGYGDPSEYDEPERFRDAYRHTIQIARDEGASNTTWVFHVNGDDVPDEQWNRLEQYYPGDGWVAWLGVSVYGAGEPTDDECPQLRDGMDAVYPRLAALSPDKPIVLLEFGVTAGNSLCDQAAWAEAGLEDLITFRWPRVMGFSWWNETWQNDDNPSHDTNMRVQDNPDLAAVFQRLVGYQPKRGRVRMAGRELPLYRPFG
jgi:hypothetical protein